jgi:glycosyltransferase involved in cell wall biosynthesis
MVQAPNPSILHVGNTAGVASNISKKQRESGMKSKVIVFNDEKYDFGADDVIAINPPFAGKLGKFCIVFEAFQRLRVFRGIVSNFDVIHFHFGSVLHIPDLNFLNGIDLPMWKMQRKRVIMHFHGSDIRWKGVPWFYQRFADEIVVSSPDLIEWAPERATWIPRPVPVNSLKPQYPEPKESHPISVVHAPTNREVKGTEFVVNAVDSLISKGFDIDLRIIEGVNHSQALQIYRTADIIVDWVNPDYGLFGMFGIEAMALGKPVIASISDTVEDHLPDGCPVLNTYPEDLESELRNLVDDKTSLKTIGEKSRDYVEKVYDIEVNIDKYNKLYFSQN